MSGAKSGAVVTAADTRGAEIPTFSLILCTVGRCDELTRFLRSVAAQGAELDYDLIIVDQNDSSDVVRNCIESSGLTSGYLHLSCPKVSLSYARNVGLPFRRGAVVAFPDDDCEYPSGLLSRVREHFRSSGHDVAGVCFRFSGDRIAPQARRVVATSSIGRIISFSFFLYAERLAGEVPRFDERLGVGAYFGACEESEFILRALRPRSYIEVTHDLLIRHPIKDLDSDQRMRSYGRGFGALARILISTRRPAGFAISSKILFGPVVRCVAALVRMRPREARAHCAGLLGRVEGMLAFRRDIPRADR